MEQRILCVADEPICSALCKLLEQWGYSAHPLPRPDLELDEPEQLSPRKAEWTDRWAEGICKMVLTDSQPDSYDVILIYAHLHHGQRSKNHGFYLADIIRSECDNTSVPVVIAVLDPQSAERSSTRRLRDPSGRAIFPVVPTACIPEYSNVTMHYQWDVLMGLREFRTTCELARRVMRNGR